MKIAAHLSALVLVSASAGAHADNSTVVNGISQVQSGTLNTQVMSIGVTQGGVVSSSTAHVVVGNVTQTQSGVLNNQSLEIGVAKNGATVNVRVNNVTQSQGGAGGTEATQIGVAP